MSVAYQPSYIDALFERRDATALHTVISVRGRDSVLPNECTLFVRVLEWLGSDWQYYHALNEEDFATVCRLLGKFGMTDVLARYQEGRSAAIDSIALTTWFEEYEADVLDELFRHARRASDFLKSNDG